MTAEPRLVSAGSPIRWRIDSTGDGRVVVYSPPPTASYVMSVAEARALAAALVDAAVDAGETAPHPRRGNPTVTDFLTERPAEPAEYIETDSGTVEVRRVVRFYDGGDDYDGFPGDVRRAILRTVRNLLGGFDGAWDSTRLPDWFATKDEQALPHGPERAHAIGGRILNRLTGGGFEDLTFLLVAEEWVRAVVDYYVERSTAEWWLSEGGVGPDRDGPRVANDVAATFAQNARRALDALGYVVDLRLVAEGKITETEPVG